MGDFAVNCAVSRLAINYGDKVRFILLGLNPFKESLAHKSCSTTGWWFPRTFPLKSTYDSYLVENIPDSLERSLWFEGLKIDLIEKGVGDNRSHNVSISKDFTFEEFIIALQEGRVEVKKIHSQLNEDFIEEKEYVPTLSNIKNVLDNSKFLIDNQRYGEVRVRVSHYNTPLEKETNELKNVKKMFPQYASVIRAGSGSYPSNVELVFFIPPNIENKTIQDFPKDNNHIISFALIREDVWQELLTISVQSMAYHRLNTIKDMKKEVHIAYNESRKAYGAEIKNILQYGSISNEYLNHVFMYNEVPSTFGLASHWSLLIKKNNLKKIEVDKILNSIAEMLYVELVLHSIRYVWVPSTMNGSQFGNDDEHVSYFNSMLKVAKKIKKENYF